jgi:hypothetical protein
MAGERERLARLITRAVDAWHDSDREPSTEEAIAAVLLAAGWRFLPTEGPEWVAAVERACLAVRALDDDCLEANVLVALRAALQPEEQTDAP